MIPFGLICLPIRDCTTRLVTPATVERIISYNQALMILSWVRTFNKLPKIVPVTCPNMIESTIQEHSNATAPKPKKCWCWIQGHVHLTFEYMYSLFTLSAKAFLGQMYSFSWVCTWQSLLKRQRGPGKPPIYLFRSSNLLLSFKWSQSRFYPLHLPHNKRYSWWNIERRLMTEWCDNVTLSHCDMTKNLGSGTKNWWKIYKNYSANCSEI